VAAADVDGLVAAVAVENVSPPSSFGTDIIYVILL
jgi:hypothetical protein